MTGSARPGKPSQGQTRPIKTKRDYDRALSITQRLLAHPNRDTVEEKRLKALLAEMDRYEEVEEDTDDGLSDDALYGGPRRRWSDDSAGD
jgi:hypothetical protein